MPRVHHVKKARKGNKDAGIKKGESYYWWKFRYGGKRTSKTPPRPSQLTQSEFWSTVYSQSEREQPDFDDLASERDEIVSELENLRDEIDGKKSNVEDAFPNGSPVLELLEERYDALEEAIGALGDVDCEPDIDEDEDKPEKESEDEKTERIASMKSDKADEIWSEVTDAIDSISCS